MLTSTFQVRHRVLSPLFVSLVMALASQTQTSQAQVLAMQTVLQDARQSMPATAERQTLKAALTDLRTHYNADILYSDQVVDGVTISQGLINYKRSLEQNLDVVLKAAGRRYKKTRNGSILIKREVTDAAPVSSTSATPSAADLDDATETAVANPQLVVTGTVSDNTGGLLPGANVYVKGNTALVSVTDANGAYSIDVPEDATLVFGYVGYVQQEIAVAGRTSIDVTLVPEAKSMEEVVVVGYGTQKKSVTTGAITRVTAADLENQPVGRIEQSLQGRTSGLTITQSSGQPGAAATVRVRGTTTIGNSDPLYVVDGVQIGGGIEYLNQADIASIEVLKDAASAAIYGARGANGVIIVTTKKGAQGKMSVNYNGTYGVQAPWRKLKMLNSQQYATLQNEQSVQGGGNVLFPNPGALTNSTNWQDAIFDEAAPIQNHELSIGGGGEKSTYFASAGYWDQKGIVSPNNSYWKRFTARLNADHKITKAISFGHNVAYTHINSQGTDVNNEFGGPLVRALNMDPITPLVETDPIRQQLPVYVNNPVVRDAAGNPYGISPYVSSEILNPIAALKVAQGQSYSDKVVANAYAAVTPVKGLTIRSSIGADLAFWGNQDFVPVYYLNSVFQRDLNAYTRGSNSGLNWIFENTASYNIAINKHNVTALIGTTALKEFGRTQGGTLRGIPATSLDDASFNFGAPQTNQAFSGGEYQYALSSLFGRLIYNYDERYLLTGIIRRDGSSRFGPNNKYGVFPSVSAGWVPSREAFWPENEAVNFLKIRGSYGVNGNDRIGDFRYVSTIGQGRNYTDNGQLQIGASPNALSNPDLKWESTTQLDIGFDAVLLRNFNLTFDWYNKETSDMLLDVAVPGYVGNNGPTANVATLRNRGYEFELGYNRRTESGFNFSVAANASYLQNEITYLGSDRQFLNGIRITPQQVEVTRTAVGQPIGYLYGYKTDGIFQSQEQINSYVDDTTGLPVQPTAQPGDFKFVDVNGDGRIDEADRTKIGDPTPDWTVGFTFSANYKGFDITIFGQGVFGNQVYQGFRRFDLPTANMTADYLGRWTGPGSTNDFPRLAAGDANQRNFGRASDFYVKDGDYFRIKTLQIGYSLPTNLISRIGLTKLRFYVGGLNLLTFTRYNGFDPEIGGGSYGVDRGIYPQARMYQAGVNIGF